MDTSLNIATKKNDPLEDIANKVLSHFKYEYPDEIDLEQILWKYGIQIMPLDPHFCPYSFEDGIKSLAVATHNRRGIIFLRPGLSYIERKVILAEEFCHIYLDSTNQLICDHLQFGKSELKAKRMAAYLLMPLHFLKNVLDLSYDQAVLISEIADYFLVTEEMAHYRLELLFKHRVDMITSIHGKLGTVEMFE